jgi:hypothetical protein
VADHLEELWVGWSLFGAVFSILALGVYVRASLVVLKAIRRQEASVRGPRWLYTFGTLLVMALFLCSWMAFLAAGTLVMTWIDPAQVRDVIRILILVGLICFAVGQVMIVVVWWMVRRAAVFIPRRQVIADMVAPPVFDPIEHMKEP